MSAIHSNVFRFRRNESGLLEITNTEEELKEISSRRAHRMSENQDGSCHGRTSPAIGTASQTSHNHYEGLNRNSTCLNLRTSRSLFVWIPSDLKNRFQPGQKLEGVDPNHPEMWCALSVADTQGHRVRVHFDGYSTDYDFWTNCWDPVIRPVGYCARTGRELCPPRGFDPELFEWKSYLDMVACSAAPASAFVTSPLPDCSNLPYRLEVNADVEIENPYEPSAPRIPGKILDIVDNRLILAGASDEHNPMIFWTRVGSPFLGPCKAQDDSGNGPRFTAGQNVEVVDPYDPSAVRLGEIKQVYRHRLRIKIVDDPDTDEEDFWLPVNSSELFPEGFCASSGYGPTGPRPGRRRCSQSRGPWQLPDRLSAPSGRKGSSSTLKCSSSVNRPIADGTSVPSSSLAWTSIESASSVVKDRLKAQTPPSDELKPDEDSESRDTVAVAEPSSALLIPRKRSLTPPPSCDTFPNDQTKIRRFSSSLSNEPPDPDSSESSLPSEMPMSVLCSSAESPCWQEFTDRHALPSAQVLRTWSVAEVADYIRSLPGTSCEHADVFLDEDIDGEALMLLSDKDMMSLLKLKLGPVLKIYSCVSYAKSLYALQLQNKEEELV